MKLFIAGAAGYIGGSVAADDKVLTLDSVELLFQRLASASLGHPHAMDGMPAGREPAAVLLIREVMHHLGYASIAIVDGDVGRFG